jgi:hypothetical protein
MIKIDTKINAIIQKEKRKILENAISELRANTPIDTGEARNGWRLEEDKIVNDVKHINSLNEGSSQQAPAYFVEATLLGIPGILPNGTIVKNK